MSQMYVLFDQTAYQKINFISTQKNSGVHYYNSISWILIDDSI